MPGTLWKHEAPASAAKGTIFLLSLVKGYMENGKIHFVLKQLKKKLIKIQ